MCEPGVRFDKFHNKSHGTLRVKTLCLNYASAFIALVSVLLATLLIVHTYTVFDQTADESAHIACGMEWLDRGTYTLEVFHPPLARVAAALLLYLAGARASRNAGYGG